MTDEELRQVVNRLNMEERYTQVMRSREAEVGKSAASEWLEKAGSALAIASSALGMAVTMKQMMDAAKNKD